MAHPVTDAEARVLLRARRVELTKHLIELNRQAKQLHADVEAAKEQLADIRARGGDPR